VILLAGEVDLDAAATATEPVGGGSPALVALPGSERRGLLVVRKVEPTPERFPRRPGAARKRPRA
jgi:16S rRNA (guanine527-N7)-methyltransferase